MTINDPEISAHQNPRSWSSSANVSMYGQNQPMNFSVQEVNTAGGGDSDIRFGTQAFEDGVVGGTVNFDGDGGGVYATADGVGTDYGGMHRTLVDDANQLTLSFRGQVFVFDAVTPEKVQAVLLLLGGSESSPASHGSESTSQTPQIYTELTSYQQKRAASLHRFRQKRKERNFDKKIRYNVRQEVALRMDRKKGQFTSAKKQEGEANCNASQDSGSDDVETICAHCGISSKNTPLMRRGPAGPRTFCNACGLAWRNKGILRDISKKSHDQPRTPSNQGGDEGGDVYSADTYSTVGEELPLPY